MNLKGFTLIETLLVFLLLSFLTFLSIKIYDTVSDHTSDAYTKQIVESTGEVISQTFITRGYWVTDPAELGTKVQGVTFINTIPTTANQVMIQGVSEGVKIATLSKSGNCLLGYVTSAGLKEDKYSIGNGNCDAMEAS